MLKSEITTQNANKLIFAKDGLTSSHLKVMGLALMKLQKTKDISKPVQVSFAEYKKWTGNIAANYTLFKKQLNKIQETSVSIESDKYNWTRWNLISWTKGSKNENGESVIDVQFNQALADLFFPAEANEIYSSIGYAYQCQLKGLYSVKFYRGFKTKYWHLSDGGRQVAFLDITLEELREWLGIEKIHKEYKNLNSRVIKPSIEEINQKTDIQVQVKELSKPVTKLRFLISKNPNPHLEKIYLEPVQIGFFDENEDLKKIWNPEVLAKIYEKTTASLYASKDMVFVGEMASKHSIEVQKVDGRWEFKGILKEETPKKSIVSNVKQIGIVKDAIKKGYKAPENWSEGSSDSVYEEVGKAKEFLDNKRVNISKILEENEAKINAKIAEKTVATEPKEEILEEKTPEIVTKKKKFLGIF